MLLGFLNIDLCAWINTSTNIHEWSTMRKITSNHRHTLYLANWNEDCEQYSNLRPLSDCLLSIIQKDSKNFYVSWKCVMLSMRWLNQTNSINDLLSGTGWITTALNGNLVVAFVWWIILQVSISLGLLFWYEQLRITALITSIMAMYYNLYT